MEHKKFHKHTQYKSKVISHLEWKMRLELVALLRLNQIYSGWHLANLKRL
jgi:hypothetical protein